MPNHLLSRACSRDRFKKVNKKTDIAQCSGDFESSEICDNECQEGKDVNNMITDGLCKPEYVMIRCVSRVMCFFCKFSSITCQPIYRKGCFLCTGDIGPIELRSRQVKMYWLSCYLY